MAKRAPSNTAESAVKAMVDAALGLPEKPAHAYLREGDQPFWEGICRARARDEWSDADLVVAAQLARCQADIERESRALDDEMTVTTNERGTQVPNARLAVIEQLARREMALMRTLRIGGYQAGKDLRDLAPRRQAEEAAKQVREESKEGDGLLAT